MEGARVLGLATAAAVALAGAGLLGALLSDGPYLSASAPSGWVIAWGIGLFALLLALPFELHRRISARTADRDRRWELAVVLWGAIAALGLVALGALALAAGAGTALRAIASVGAAECALVVVSVLALMLTTG